MPDSRPGMRKSANAINRGKILHAENPLSQGVQGPSDLRFPRRDLAPPSGDPSRCMDRCRSFERGAGECRPAWCATRYAAKRFQSGDPTHKRIPPPASGSPVRRRDDGSLVSCHEKIKVMNENLAEIRQMAQDAFEDALLMGCSEAQVREVFVAVMRDLRNPWPGRSA